MANPVDVVAEIAMRMSGSIARSARASLRATSVSPTLIEWIHVHLPDRKVSQSRSLNQPKRCPKFSLYPPRRRIRTRKPGIKAAATNGASNRYKRSGEMTFSGMDWGVDTERWLNQQYVK
jgi:hypothetical protein